jgi:hypothetical protein
MHPITDPAILALPHPVRVDAALGEPMEALLFDQLGLREQPKPYLADQGATTEWLLNEIPALSALAIAGIDAPGSHNLGTFVLMLDRARLRAQGDPILETAAPLQAQLAATDLSEGLPVRFFRSPYAVVYIAFARPCPLQVFNRATGLHALEGAYVSSYEVPPGHPLHQRRRRSAALRLDPRRSTRVVELTFTGSPIGKRDALDDASQDIVLFIQDEDECLRTLLERHNTYYASPEASETPGFLPPLPEEVRCATDNIEALAKVLLYLNLPEAQQTPLTERSELEKKLRALGPKKAARLRRRLRVAYDRIVIGPRVDAEFDAGADTADRPEHHVRPHWRRGHFRRIRFGEGLSESRLGWIEPVLVNAAEAFGSVKAKGYVVR